MPEECDSLTLLTLVTALEGGLKKLPESLALTVTHDLLLASLLRPAGVHCSVKASLCRGRKSPSLYSLIIRADVRATEGGTGNKQTNNHNNHLHLLGLSLLIIKPNIPGLGGHPAVSKDYEPI